MIPHHFETTADLMVALQDRARRGITADETRDLLLALERSTLPGFDGDDTYEPGCEECAVRDAEDEADLPFLGLADKLEHLVAEIGGLPAGHGADDVVAAMTRWLALVQGEHGYDLTDVLRRLEATRSNRKTLMYGMRELRAWSHSTATRLGRRALLYVLDEADRAVRSARTALGHPRTSSAPK